MIYKKLTLDNNNKRILGWCDGCECDLYPRDPFWLVLLPGQRKITALCKKCRDWMVQCLSDDDNLVEHGMYEFRWGRNMMLIDHVERSTMLEQIDDDERIEEGDDEE